MNNKKDLEYLQNQLGVRDSMILNRLIDNHLEKIYRLQQRIDKAIEYIEEKQIQNEYTDRCGFRVKENKWWLEDSDILLEILEDKEVEDE